MKNETALKAGPFALCLSLLLTTLPMRADNRHDHQSLKPLLPIVRIYLDLNLCANVFYKYKKNNTLGNFFLYQAVELKDTASERGWSVDDFSTAMVLVYRSVNSLIYYQLDSALPEPLTS
jgi:hypothetical protein